MVIVAASRSCCSERCLSLNRKFSLAEFVPESRKRISVHRNGSSRHGSCKVTYCVQESFSEGNLFKKLSEFENSREHPFHVDEYKGSSQQLMRIRESWERELRKHQWPSSCRTINWMRKTTNKIGLPDGSTKKRFLDQRSAYRYKPHVESAIEVVRQLSSVPPDLIVMRKVMVPWIGRLSFREMCVVLKEQHDWRQALNFFEWMKLQMSYTPSVVPYTILIQTFAHNEKLHLAEQAFMEMLEVGCAPDEVMFSTMLNAYGQEKKIKEMMTLYQVMRQNGIAPSVISLCKMLTYLNNAECFTEATCLSEHALDDDLELSPFCYSLMITSFKKQQAWDGIVRAFLRMKAERYWPDEITYNTVIDAMGKLGMYWAASDVFETMKEQGIIPSKYTYATMMNVYCRANDFKGAGEVFSELKRSGCTPDEAVYNLVLKMYGEVGYYDEAEQVFKEMQQLGLLLDAKSYTVMAKIQVKAERYSLAMELFDEMQSKGIRMTSYAWNTLLHCYVQEKNLPKASKLFAVIHDIGLASAVAYTNMVVLYTSLKDVEGVKILISKLHDNEVRPDEEFYGAVVNCFCSLGSIDDIEAIVEDMRKEGITPNTIIKKMLLRGYSKFNRFKEAENVFCSLHKADVETVNIMMNIYRRSGRETVVSALLESLPDLKTDVDHLTYSHLVTQLAKAGKAKEAESLTAHIIAKGFNISEPTLIGLIAMYGQKNEYSKVMDLFRGFSAAYAVPSKHLYNTMIDVSAKCKQLREAINMFKQMDSLGLEHNSVTISIMVNAYTKEGMYKQAEDLIQKVLSDNYTLDTAAYNSFMKAFLEAGRWKEASSIFSRMRGEGVDLNIQTYSIAMSVFAEAGDVEKCTSLFEELQASELGIDERAYGHMIRIYGKLGHLQKAIELFHRMQQNGFQPRLITFNTMVDLLAKAGYLEQARELIDGMSKQGIIPDELTYLCLLSTIGRIKVQVQEAEDVLYLMQHRGLKPDVRHYTSVIRAYGRVAMVDDAVRVFSDMVDKAGLKPDLASYRTLLKVFSKYGKFDQGIALFAKLRKERLLLDGHLYTLAVDLYVKANRLEEARSLIMQMCNLGFRYRGKFAINLTREVIALLQSKGMMPWVSGGRKVQKGESENKNRSFPSDSRMKIWKKTACGDLDQ